ncbi:MAG TPA: hypothetical protein VNQ99_11770 [Xanthobacteraceae bacterium]|nr:hypothetical protein [Xanthobacteraceae bacterium]
MEAVSVRVPLHSPYPQHPDTLEEACAENFRAMAATLCFALSRLPADGRPAVICMTAAQTHEYGRIFGRGTIWARHFPLLLVEPRKAIEALWAAEQALRSGAVAGVAIAVDDLTLTQTRRLEFAARHGGASAMTVLTRPGGLTAARRRWRIRPAPSAPNPFDARAPGSLRIAAELVRSRTEPPALFMLEQDDETHRLRLADRLAGHGLVEAGRTVAAA